MAKKQKLLTKFQILQRLKKAGGNPWDEVFKILGVPLDIADPTEQENEQPADNQIYKVNFVPKRNDTAQIDNQQTEKEENTLFYRHAPHMESLVFAPHHVAKHISQIHNAFGAQTWGEFQEKIPEEELDELLRLRHEQFGELFVIPEQDVPFEHEALCPAFSDGDYPRWLQTEQARWIPKEILARWGEAQMSVLNGPFWIINPTQEQKIVRRLTELGIPTQRRDDLRFH